MCMPRLRRALSTPWSSSSVIAKSPSTLAISSVPANAAHVLTPICLPIFAPWCVAARPNRDLVHAVVHLPLVSENLVDWPGGDLVSVGTDLPANARAGSAEADRTARWASIDFLYRGREFRGVSGSADVHVHHARRFKEEMVVKSSDFKPVVESCRHCRAYLVF